MVVIHRKISQLLVWLSYAFQRFFFSLLLLSSVFTCVWALLSKSLHSLNNTRTCRERIEVEKVDTNKIHSFTLTWYEMAFISFCKDVPTLQNARKTSNEWQLLLISSMYYIWVVHARCSSSYRQAVGIMLMMVTTVKLHQKAPHVAYHYCNLSLLLSSHLRLRVGQICVYGSTQITCD